MYCTLEVQADYFLNGFSVKAIVLARVYYQQILGNVIFMVFDFQGVVYTYNWCVERRSKCGKKICYGMFLGWRRLTFYTQKEDAGISWHIFRFHISCSRYTKYREWHPHPIIQNVGFTGPWPLGLSGATAYTPKHYMLFLYSSHPLSAHVGNTPYIAWNIAILFHNFIYFYNCHCWELQFMGSWLLKEWNLPPEQNIWFSIPESDHSRAPYITPSFN